MSSFTLVTGGYDTSIRFFDATNQTMIRTIQFCDQQVLRLSFSSDRPVSHNAPLFLIAGGSPSVAVYDVTTPHTSPNLFQVYQRHTEAVTAVGFEPKHTAFVFSASEDGSIHTWLPDLAAAHHPAPNPAYSQSPHLLPPVVHPMAPGAYQPDGRLRFPSVPAVMENHGPNGLVPIHDAVYYPPKDLFFSADFLGRLRIWNHASASLVASVLPHPSKRNLQCIDLSSDHNTIVLANFDGFVFVYNVPALLANPSDAIPIYFSACDRYVPRVRLSVSSALLVCTTCSGVIKVFRMSDIIAHRTTPARPPFSLSKPQPPPQDTVGPVREFTGHRGWVWDAVFVEDRDDYLFTCSSNKQVMLWPLNDLHNSTEYAGHQKGVVCLAVRERMSRNISPEEFVSSPPENPSNVPDHDQTHSLDTDPSP